MPKQVLVVEDDAGVRNLVQLVIEDAGYDVQTAQHGREALDHLIQPLPDLVVSDVMMPILDGWELCRAIHANPVTNKIPLVIMTAGANRISKADCPYDAFLAKPLDIDQLVTTITTLIGEPDHERAGAGSDNNAI